MKEIHVKAKQDEITGAASTITTNNLTTSRALVSDSSGKVAVSAVTSTELGYLDGVTSNIQTQLNGKQAAISGTANSVMITDANGKPTVSSVITVSELNKLNGLTPTTTELNHLDGVTSNVQTQLNAKASFPNYSGSVTKLDVSDNYTYKPTTNGYLHIIAGFNKSLLNIYIGNCYFFVGEAETDHGAQNLLIPVAKGTNIRFGSCTNVNNTHVLWISA